MISSESETKERETEKPGQTLLGTEPLAYQPPDLGQEQLD